MLETALHTGAEHPDLWSVVVPASLTFLAGLVLGSRADSIRAWGERRSRTDDAR